MARGAHWGAARPAPLPCLCIPGQRHPAGPCLYGNQRADRAAWSQARQLVELEGSRRGYKALLLLLLPGSSPSDSFQACAIIA